MNLKSRYRKLVSPLPFKGLSLWVLGINLTVVSVILFAKRYLPPTVPLFYGKPYGAEQLTGSANLAIPPLAALFLSLINILVAAFIGDEFLKKVIFGSMIVVSVLSLITVLKIFILVGSV